MNQYKKLKALHAQESPLVLGNVWNVSSAQLFEKNGFKAIGTSSSALANSLGYEDGQKMPFSELLYMAERITKSVTIPFTVDIEAGYSEDLQQLANNIKQLHQIGVAGFNIEDSVLTDSRRLLPPADFCRTLAFIRNVLDKNNIKLFINIRTDTYLLDIPQKLEASLIRIKAYDAAGADGIFIPCITAEEDIKTVVSSTKLPINVMCMPDLPSFKKLQELGVKRISMGNFVYDSVQKEFNKLVNQIITDHSFKSLF